MATPIYFKNLELFIEAQEHGGANGDAIASVNDLSPNNRDLTCGTSRPTVKTNAINGKRSFQWNGAKNPLVFEGDFTINCGFLVVKCTGEFIDPYAGLLSTIEDFGILVGTGDSDRFFDFGYDYFEYRLNDRIYPKTDAPAPIDAFGIIYFKFWQGLEVEGIQLGQDRGFEDRKFIGEVALLALYNRHFCESEIRKMFRSLAFSYQIALPDVFPFQGSKGNTVTSSKRVLTDEQDEPVVRVKRGARKLFDLSFSNRHQTELLEAERFWDEFYPAKKFLYRDYQLIPPVDTICRFPVPSEFQRAGGLTVGSNQYGFQVFESIIAPASSIPSSAPTIPNEGPPVPINVALAANGATATANRTDLGSAANCIDGSRVPAGSFATNGLQANGSTAWLEVNFNLARTIQEINIIFANASNSNDSGEPTLSTLGGFMAAPDFTVEYWNGAAWTVIETVTGNDKQWRQFTFDPVSTTKIRLNVSQTSGGALYFLEMEAWGN